MGAPKPSPLLLARVGAAFEAAPADKVWTLAMLIKHLDPADHRPRASFHTLVSMAAPMAAKALGMVKITEQRRTHYVHPSHLEEWRRQNPPKSSRRKKAARASQLLPADQLIERIGLLFWDRRERPLTVDDILRGLFPADAEARDRHRAKVRKAALLAAREIDWHRGILNGVEWFASPSVAPTMRPKPKPIVAKRLPRPKPSDRIIFDHPIANRVARAFEAHKGDALTIEQLTVEAFRAMAVYRTASDAVKSVAPTVGAALGWKLVDRQDGPAYVRADEDAQATFEEAT